MKQNQILTSKRNKRLWSILLIAAGVLLIPLVAMQFTEEVKWNTTDFIAAGLLLLSGGLTLEFIVRKVKTLQLKIAACATLFIVLLLIWAELAVGIFGSPFACS